jgi:hypothetical protein
MDTPPILYGLYVFQARYAIIYSVNSLGRALHIVLPQNILSQDIVPNNNIRMTCVIFVKSVQ